MEPEKTAEILKERLRDEGYKHIKIIKKPGVGELLSVHYEIKIDKETVAFIYEPIGCQSYNTIRVGNRDVRVATIDTMLMFYLAFTYANRPYYDNDRIICMAEYLFKIQQKNRLQQKGLLRRFSINCYGKQETIEDMRNEKNEKFKELKNNKDSREYQERFLKYSVDNTDNASAKKKKKKTRKQHDKKQKRKKKKTRRFNRFLNLI